MQAAPRFRLYLVMNAAVLHQHGAPPEYGEFAEPHAADGHVIVEVEAAGVHHLDLARASGEFYGGAPPLPSVVGGDGVGHLPDGRRVFFESVLAPHGSMAERTVVPQDAVFEIADGVESAVAAALGNTGLAAWLALEWRARLGRGETVLVLGATGAVGSAAVQIARELGAGRVIAADLPGERLARLEADAAVELRDDEDLTAAFNRAAPDGVDVIIDPLWGPPALAAMGAARRGARHVQIGQIASPTLTLPAPLVRSVALNVMGFAVFYAPLEVRRAAYLRVTELAARGGLTVDLEVLPLAEIGAAWDRQRQGNGTKLVIACAERTGVGERT
jgi:NADPH:quinone reductase-like Zn-dependent oxidoreductase